MKERNQQLEQATAQIKAECWDSMEVHRETVSALKAPLKVGPASHFSFLLHEQWDLNPRPPA